MQMMDDQEECEEEELTPEIVEVGIALEDIYLSLHAMWGTKAPQIMRIRGVSRGKTLKVLFDTGITHNFLSGRVRERLQCEVMEVPPRAMEVANGQMLQCTHKCVEFSWEMQGTTFLAEVYIIGLETYDLILGVQWLRPLGRICWDFSEMSMLFELKGVEVRLTGEKESSSKDQLQCIRGWNEQILGEDEVKISAVMTTVEGESMSCFSVSQENMWPELGEVLQDFEEVFEEPRGLPP